MVFPSGCGDAVTSIAGMLEQGHVGGEQVNL